MENEHGSIKMTDEAIAICAAKAAIDLPGIYSLSSGITDAISENLLRKSPDTRGVRVNQGEDTLVLDLYIVVDYGVRIPSVAWNIQEKVKAEVEEFTGMTVSFVNIHVQGIHFPEENA